MNNSKNEGFNFYQLVLDVLLGFVVYIICFAMFI